VCTSLGLALLRDPPRQEVGHWTFDFSAGWVGPAVEADRALNWGIFPSSCSLDCPSRPTVFSTATFVAIALRSRPCAQLRNIPQLPSRPTVFSGGEYSPPVRLAAATVLWSTPPQPRWCDWTSRSARRTTCLCSARAQRSCRLLQPTPGHFLPDLGRNSFASGRAGFAVEADRARSTACSLAVASRASNAAYVSRISDDDHPVECILRLRIGNRRQGVMVCG
jgi:hypothetical protein